MNIKLPNITFNSKQTKQLNYQPEKIGKNVKGDKPVYCKALIQPLANPGIPQIANNFNILIKNSAADKKILPGL